MVKLYDINHPEYGYMEVDVGEFYCNDYPLFFARTGKGTYIRDTEPIYTVPKMTNGSVPRDGGNLILSPEDKDELVAKNPLAEKYIFRYVGSEEFINNKLRFCLWLEDCPPNELRKMSLVYKRVQAVRDFRLASPREATRKVAETSWLFAERRQPKTNYLLMPSVSSDRRKYVPIGYMDANVIASNLVFTIPDTKLWHFGVLTSLPHMAWMRVTCGRLGISYRYSATVVYNNFAWPPFNREVEQTALNILMIRRKYPDASYADLYDPLVMPRDLRKAHEENDRAVMEAYDFPGGMSEFDMFNALMNLYERTVNMQKIFYGKDD